MTVETIDIRHSAVRTYFKASLGSTNAEILSSRECISHSCVCVAAQTRIYRICPLGIALILRDRAADPVQVSGAAVFDRYYDTFGHVVGMELAQAVP